MNILGIREDYLEQRLVQTAKRLPIPLAFLAICFSILALLGYWLDIPILYRPLPAEPATNPITAICFIFLAGAFLSQKLGVWGNYLHSSLTWLTLIICFFKILDTPVGNFFNQFFIDISEQPLGSNPFSSVMSINTAIMQALISASLLFFQFRQYHWSQLLASISLIIPMISLTGYAYQIEVFYDQMSIITALLGVALATATLALSAEHFAVRAILSPYQGGRVARLQGLIGYFFPTLCGYFLIKFFLEDPTSQNLVGMFVVMTCWFIIVMVSFSAIYLEQAELQRREVMNSLTDAAVTDELSGIPNRRYFLEKAETEIQRIKRYGGELWLLILDIDNFKRINDNAGHQVGDEAITLIAQTLKQSMREVDVVARFGGEEFAVLLTGTDQEGCIRVAEKIRHRVESIELPLWTPSNGAITVSIGCASLVEGVSIEDAYLKADKALYHAKTHGKNQVVLFDVDELGEKHRQKDWVYNLTAEEGKRIKPRK